MSDIPVGACPSCAKYEQDIQLAEQQMRGLRRQLSALRTQLAGEKKNDPKAPEVARLLELWRDKVKGGRKNVSVSVEHPRAEAFRKALSLYPVKDIEDAIRGITLDSWWMEKACEPKHILKNLERFRDGWRDRQSRYLADAEQRLSGPKADPVSKVLRAVERVARTNPPWRAVPSNPDGWQACCPAHDDTKPSLSITRNPQTGKVKVKCWSGCDDLQVLEVLGLQVRDLYENADLDFQSEAGVLRAASEYLDRKNVVTLREAA